MTVIRLSQIIDTDSEILSRLRRLTACPVPQTSTSKYRSFIHCALTKYQ